MRATALAGVVLAAGLGSRLRPLTDLRPKALVPVAGVALLDGALDRVSAVCGAGPASVAVNAHHHADAVAEAVGGRAHTSRESEPLGTAGALGALAGWLAGRDVLVTNVDAWMPGGRKSVASLVAGWDGERCRLLCTPAVRRRDFTLPDGSGVTYVGTALLPGRLVSRLPATPSGLYEVLWRSEAAAGRLDLHVAHGPGLGPGGGPDGVVAVDCGTPTDYLRANLLASGGRSVIGHGAVVEGRVERSVIGDGAVVEGRVERSVIGDGAVVEGRVERSVVWDGAHVGPGEHLVDAVRAGTRERPVTVRV